MEISESGLALVSRSRRVAITSHMRKDSVTSYTRSIPNDTQHGSMATQLMPWR